ncbi:hypothetical protein ACIBCU_22515 [Streptomyces sp. NPDC051064]
MPLPAHPVPYAHLRWRNANARHRDVLVTDRKERVRVRRHSHAPGLTGAA